MLWTEGHLTDAAIAQLLQTKTANAAAGKLRGAQDAACPARSDAPQPWQKRSTTFAVQLRHLDACDWPAAEAASPLSFPHWLPWSRGKLLSHAPAAARLQLLKMALAPLQGPGVVSVLAVSRAPGFRSQPCRAERAGRAILPAKCLRLSHVGADKKGDTHALFYPPTNPSQIASCKAQRPGHVPAAAARDLRWSRNVFSKQRSAVPEKARGFKVLPHPTARVCVSPSAGAAAPCMQRGKGQTHRHLQPAACPLPYRR